MVYDEDFIDQITYLEINLPKKLEEDNRDICEFASGGDVESIFKIASLLAFYPDNESTDNEIYLYRFAARWNSTQAMLSAINLMLKHKPLTETAEYCYYYLSHIYKSGSLLKDLNVVEHLVLIAKQLLNDNPIDFIASCKQFIDLFDKIEEEQLPEKIIKKECEFELSPRLIRFRNLMDGLKGAGGIHESIRNVINSYNGFVRGSPTDAMYMAKCFEKGTIEGEPVDLLSANQLYGFAAKKGLVAGMSAHLNTLIDLQKFNEAFIFSLTYLKELLERSNRSNSEKEEVRTVLKCVANVLKFAHLKNVCHDDMVKNVINLSEKMLELGIIDESTLSDMYTLQGSILSTEDKSIVIVAKDKFVEGGDFRLGQFSVLWKPVELVDSPISDSLDILDEQFPWMKKVTQNIRNQIRSREFGSNRAFKIRPILLVGLPGGGKTTYCKALADIISVPFRAYMAAGSEGAMSMRGVPRGYSTACAGFIPRFIAQEKVANGLILVDEIDKVSTGRHNGSLHDVMLQLLETATSTVYYDEALEVRLDLSHINWIATANGLSTIPKPLLSRFEVILAGEPDINGYAQAIARTRLDYAKELRIDERMMPLLTNEDIEFLIEGCKSLREISKVTRRILEDRMCAKKPVMH